MWQDDSRPGFDSRTPNAARIYDYMLGGKDHFPADRAATAAVLAVLPDSANACRDNRDFLQRAVRFLAGEAGIRQFLDIGTGLPTMGNVHEVAQEIAPDARIAYVDYDPVVLTHARALLATSPSVAVIEGDLRKPDAILSDEKLQRLVDFRKPVAVLLVAIVHFLDEDDEPHAVMDALKDAMPPGSYLALSHITDDEVTGEASQAAQEAYQGASAGVTPRSLAQVTRFFDGLDIIPPGIVSVSAWRPDLPPHRPAREQPRSLIYGGVARKP